MAKKTSTPSLSDAEIIKITEAYYTEAEEARRDRVARNKLNWDVYYGKIDWSHKLAGQSTEHLPKLAGAIEQMTAFVKRALVGYGNWFAIDVPSNYPISPEAARQLLLNFLNKCVVAGGEMMPIHSIIGMAVKQGLMESKIVLKVHGGPVGERSYKVEKGDLLAGIPDKLTANETQNWRLRIDIVPSEDYYPDPTGRMLYKIHEVERDYADVLEDAENGMYDLAECKKITEDVVKTNDLNKRNARQRNQNETSKPKQRRKVVVRECWGTLLNDEGYPAFKDVVWTIANGKHLIRKPTPYPFWHGTDPFIDANVLQNPHSTWSKAMFDDVASLNIALDELYNLILDGGIAAVWGVRQVRAHWLEDPRQISGGVPQAATLLLSEDAPADGKVIETVTTSQVPQDAMAVLQMTDRELNGAAFQNDIRLGNFPSRSVKATEVVEASQNSSVLVDSFASDIDCRVIEPMLRKAWYTLLQFASDLPSEDVVEAIGLSATFSIARMSDAERYANLAKVNFKATGLSATLARARDFQKFMAAMQVCMANPVLMESFVRRISGDKALETIFRMMNLNIEDFALTEDEQKQMQAKMENMQMLGGMMGGQQQGSPINPGTAGGERSLTNEARSDTSSNVEANQQYGNS